MISFFLPYTVTTLLTIYALFGDDIRVAKTPFGTMTQNEKWYNMKTKNPLCYYVVFFRPVQKYIKFPSYLTQKVFVLEIVP